MATKTEVLKLLDKGLTPSEVAERLNCTSAYVRATRQRATPEGHARANGWARNWQRRKAEASHA